jgi:hypothetical protein
MPCRNHAASCRKIVLCLTFPAHAAPSGSRSPRKAGRDIDDRSTEPRWAASLVGQVRSGLSPGGKRIPTPGPTLTKVSAGVLPKGDPRTTGWGPVLSSSPRINEAQRGLRVASGPDAGTGCRGFPPTGGLGSYRPRGGPAETPKRALQNALNGLGEIPSRAPTGAFGRGGLRLRRTRDGCQLRALRKFRRNPSELGEKVAEGVERGGSTLGSLARR